MFDCYIYIARIHVLRLLCSEKSRSEPGGVFLPSDNPPLKNSLFALKLDFRNSVTSGCAVGGAGVQKSRLPATSNVYNFSGFVRPIAIDRATRMGAGKRHDRKQTTFERCLIGFAEMTSVRIIWGISNTQSCNPILVIPPNAIINPRVPLCVGFRCSLRCKA